MAGGSSRRGPGKNDRSTRGRRAPGATPREPHAHQGERFRDEGEAKTEARPPSPGRPPTARATARTGAPYAPARQATALRRMPRARRSRRLPGPEGDDVHAVRGGSRDAAEGRRAPVTKSIPPAKRSSRRPPKPKKKPLRPTFRIYADDVMADDALRYVADVWTRFDGDRKRIKAAQTAAGRMARWKLGQR
jgi:hypothetical protein